MRPLRLNEHTNRMNHLSVLHIKSISRQQVLPTAGEKMLSLIQQLMCSCHVIEKYMRGRYFPFAIVLLLPLTSVAQYGKDIVLMNNRIIVNRAESTIYAFVSPEKSAKETHDDLFYYWFASNDIKHTRGAYDGKLLHGQYTEFYLNKNLKEKGTIKYGLKKGIWKSWYPNGEYKDIVRYKKSMKVWHRAFYETGALQSTGKYKNNKLHGTVHNYTQEGKLEKVKYKNGTVVPKVQKKNRLLFWKSKSKNILKDTVTSEQPIKKRPWWKRKKKEEAQPLTPGNVNPSPGPEIPGAPQNEGRKGKSKKAKEENVKVRKFLWIIPLQPAPAKEKQT